MVSAISVLAPVLLLYNSGYIGMGQISAKIQNVSQNIGIYRSKYQLLAEYWQNENIGISGQYVCANILVSAKIAARIIYQYRMDPYWSNPNIGP